MEKIDDMELQISLTLKSTAENLTQQAVRAQRAADSYANTLREKYSLGDGDSIEMDGVILRSIVLKLIPAE